MFRKRREEFTLPAELLQCADEFEYGDSEVALDLAEQARARLDDYYRGQPHSRRRAEALVAAYAGRALADLGRFDEATPNLERAAAELPACDPEGGRSPDVDLLWTVFSLAIVGYFTNQPQESLEWSNRLLALLPPPDANRATWPITTTRRLRRDVLQHLLCRTLIARGAAELRLGQADIALATVERAYAVAADDEHLQSHSLRMRSACQVVLKNYPAAEADADAVMGFIADGACADEALAAARHYDDAVTAQGRKADSLSRWAIALAMTRQTYSGTEYLAELILDYANTLNECRHPDQALALVEEAESLVGPEPSQLLAYWWAVKGEGMYRTGHNSDAVAALDRSLALAGTLFTAENEPALYDEIRQVRAKLSPAELSDRSGTGA